MEWDAELARAELVRFDALMQFHLRRIEDEKDAKTATKFTDVFENLAISARRIKKDMRPSGGE